MTSDEIREYCYPYLHPCMECFYWRSTGRGQLYMCDYNTIHDELRGCYPDHINRTCGKFRPKNKKVKIKNKFNGGVL